MIWIVLGVIFLTFGVIVFRGAPYVPTHKRTVEALLDELPLKPGDIFVDVGSGDGVVLKLAAQRGYKAVGYELNPFLCLIAFMRCWPVRHSVKIYWRDFWLTSLPPNTKVVFTFLAGPFMQKFARKMAAHQKPLIVASNGFAIPGWRQQKIIRGIYLYSLPDALQRGE